MLNSAFNVITGNTDDYYPSANAKEIDEINQFVYDNINNGFIVVVCHHQQAYEEAFDALFLALETIEKRLAHQHFSLMMG